MRLFIAVEAAQQVRDALSAAQDALRKAGADIRWVDPGRMHLTLVFLAPVVILVLHRSRQPVRWTVLGLILGLSVYVLLPLRAASGLPVGWGDARTPSGLWWIISGGPYRRFAFALPVAQLPARLVSWARITVEQFGIPGAIVAGLGLLGLRGTDRRFFWGTVGAVALCAVFALGYDTTDSHLYLIPALVCAATWLGVGADWLIDGAQKLKPRMGWLLAAGAVAMPLIGAVMRWPAQDLSRERSAAAFAEATLWAAPQRAVLLSREDGHTFALWYYHYALGHRPDVAIVDVDLLSHTWYVEQLQPRLDVTEIQKVRQGSPDALTTAAAHLSRSICLVYGEYLQCVAP